MVLNSTVPTDYSEMRQIFPLALRGCEGFNFLKLKSVRQL